mmetsp:Transcript_31455/g.63901  ORF Transcript_31455/g.63901 Transcript_31455/m.63901 type:complete len:213 (-) Transcript_31455:302-940(-)
MPRLGREWKNGTKYWGSIRWMRQCCAKGNENDALLGTVRLPKKRYRAGSAISKPTASPLRAHSLARPLLMARSWTGIGGSARLWLPTARRGGSAATWLCCASLWGDFKPSIPATAPPPMAAAVRQLQGSAFSTLQSSGTTITRESSLAALKMAGQKEGQQHRPTSATTTFPRNSRTALPSPPCRQTRPSSSVRSAACAPPSFSSSWLTTAER